MGQNLIFSHFLWGCPPVLPRLETALCLTYFITVQAEESYVCIYSNRDADVILFCHEGGVDIGDVESKVSQPCSLMAILYA